MELQASETAARTADITVEDAERIRRQRRNLYAYLVLRTISIAGDSAWLFGVAWTAGIAGGPSALGTLLAVAAIPRLALMPVAGSLSDRWGIRRTMIIADLAAAVVALATAAAWSLYGSHVLTLYLGVMLFSCIESFYVPSSSAFVRLVVDKDLLARATSLRQSAGSVAGIAGTAAGGALVAFNGFAAAAAADGVTFLTLGVCLRFIRVRASFVPDSVESQGSVRAGVKLAVTLFWNTPVLRYSLARAFMVNCLGVAFINVGLVLQAQSRDWAASKFAFVDISLSAGTIVGGLLLARIQIREPVGLVVSWAFIVFGVITVAMAINPPYFLLCALAFMLGVMLVPVAGLGDAVVYAHLPDNRLAATTAVMITITTAAVPLGTAGIGVIASAAGVLPANMIITTSLLATAILTIFVKDVRRARISDAGD